MNLFKNTILTLFALTFFILPSFALAVEPVATVNILNAQLLSQEGNKLSLSFNVTNGVGVQTGVKYGVQLISKTAKGNFVADEKVYDETITLQENATVLKKITYTAPSQLDGTYTLVINSENESGFPFGVAVVKDIVLTASTKGVNLLPETCYVQVVGGTSPQYGLSQGVDIGGDEKLGVACEAFNTADTEVSVTPTFETRYGGAFGPIVSETTGGNATPISFAANEKKTVYITLPKGTTPQFYDVKVRLVSSNSASQAVSVRYIVRGTTATIQKLSLDKDSYKKGDTAEVSLVWSATGATYVRSKPSVESTSTTFSLNMTVATAAGKECVPSITQNLVRPTNEQPQTIIPVTLDKNCHNPQVSATLTDAAGTVLDKKEFAFKAASKVRPIDIAITVIALVGIGAWFYKKKKHTTNQQVQ